MGRDKALLDLGGRPLIEHAVRKPRRVCAEVRILAGAEEGDFARAQALGAYGPVVFDLHTGCGAIGGIEAALADSAYEWSVMLPVDMPFVPADFLEGWIARVTAAGTRCRVAMLSVEGRAQPALCLLHREVGPLIAGAVARGEWKLMAALERAAEVLAARHGLRREEVLRVEAVDGIRWMNVNTPEEFAEAERRSAELDG
jgi:molybdopterin-guanine dinucleotide biosynthesis protein A